MGLSPKQANGTLDRYLTEIAAHCLQALGGAVGTLAWDRDGIMVREQIIQDYLRATFLPLVGEKGRPEYLPRPSNSFARHSNELATNSLTLVGAHYRSPVSLRGRRSAFAVRSLYLKESRGRYLECKTPYATLPQYEEFWQAVFLEQYFKLFGRSKTLSEWVLLHSEELPFAVKVMTAPGHPKVERRRLARGKEILVITLDKEISELLVCDKIQTVFCTLLARAIDSTLTGNRQYQKVLRCSADNGVPNVGQLQTWHDLLRSTNSLAEKLVADSGVGYILRTRCSYVSGQFMYQRKFRDFRVALLSELGKALSSGENDVEAERSDYEVVSDFTRVFQSLQVYLRLYGGNCITIPYEAAVQARHASRRQIPFPSCSLTMFWDKEDESVDPLLNVVDTRARALFENIITYVKEAYSREPNHHTEGNADEMIKSISDASHTAIRGEYVRVLMKLIEDLAAARHEGEDLAFSIILGTPDHLITDLEIAHEFIGKAARLKLTWPNNDDHLFEYSTSLIRGNYSFLQDSTLALFISYPGEPLEITHIVKLRGQELTRRALLREQTKDKSNIVAGVSYGRGRGEIIHQGDIQGVFSNSGGWKRGTGYDDFSKGLNQRLEALELPDTSSRLVEILQLVVRRISEEYGLGALFVVATAEKLEKLKKRSSPLTKVLDSVDGKKVEELGADLLFQLAIEDGATLIAFDNGRAWGRWQLPAERLDDLHAEWKKHWKEWYKTMKWGTRHLTALGVSRILGDAGLVVVISADGPIHVMQNGMAVQSFGD